MGWWSAEEADAKENKDNSMSVSMIIRTI